HRRMHAAHRTVRVLAQLVNPQLHTQRVEVHHAPDQRPAHTEDEFDRLERLDASHQAGEDAENAGFRAAGRSARRWWFREGAPMARALSGIEHSRLALELEDAAVDV